jgi:hypothetical protein
MRCTQQFSRLRKRRIAAGLQRLLSTALVLGLLVSTAAAFAITEGLKLTKSPITRTQVPIKAFSPICDCDRDAAVLKFWLRKGDALTLDVVDGRRRPVKRLVDGVFAHRKWNRFVWDGRTDAGSVAPDGSYRFQVKLADAHRTILLPNRIDVDTKPARVLEASASREELSPDGDGQADSVKIRYRLSKKAHAILYVRGKRAVFTKFARREDALTWYGRAGGAGLPQGTYRLRVGAQDAAGNVTPSADQKVVLVHVRYVALARTTLSVKAGTRFGVGVDTGARSYDWRLGPVRGRSSAEVLVVRAPRRPGLYRLVVEANGHRDHALVVVRPR